MEALSIITKLGIINLNYFKMKINFEELGVYFFAYMFAGIAIFCLVAGFKGYTYHFYTAFMAAIVSAIIFAEIRKENKKK